MIHEGFPTVPLADIYAMIAYYLAKRAEVDTDLQTIDEASARTRQELETRHPPPTKVELQVRLQAKKGE